MPGWLVVRDHPRKCGTWTGETREGGARETTDDGRNGRLGYYRIRFPFALEYVRALFRDPAGTRRPSGRGREGREGSRSHISLDLQDKRYRRNHRSIIPECGMETNPAEPAEAWFRVYR